MQPGGINRCVLIGGAFLNRIGLAENQLIDLCTDNRAKGFQLRSALDFLRGVVVRALPCGRSSVRPQRLPTIFKRHWGGVEERFAWNKKGSLTMR